MACVTLDPLSGTVFTNPLLRSDHVTRSDTRHVKQINVHVLISMNEFTADTKLNIYDDVIRL